MRGGLEDWRARLEKEKHLLAEEEGTYIHKKKILGQVPGYIV